MDEQQVQTQETTNEQQGSLSPALALHSMSLGEKMKYGLYVGVPAGLGLEIMGAGGVGLTVATILALTAGYWSEEIRDGLIDRLPAPRKVGKTRQSKLSWWLTGQSPVQDTEQEDPKQEDHAEQEERQQQDVPAAQPSSIPAQFRLGDQQLTAIKEVNAKRYVYFGKTSTDVVVIPINNMYHVLDVASSGKGKSNRFRLAMMQVVELAETYFINPLANNVKAVEDDRQIEVWKPIFDRLANKKPVKDGPDILRLMHALVREIETRNEQEERGDFSWKKKPIFVFIDELPEVFARCSDAIELLDRIGRTGRQFSVFAWVASQTAQVKDIGLSTASQAQFKTRIYGGGDKTSADRVMKGSIAKEDEKALQSSGAGLTLMLADGFSDQAFVRAPLLTNEALFAYFGLPPFQMEDWLAPVKSHQIVQRLDDSESVKTNLFPFTLFPDAPNQAQNERKTVEEKVKGKSGKRVKGPHDDAILQAMDELEEEEKPLTLHAIAKKANLTRHQYDDIEDVAIEYGYELDRGKGRPAKEG